MEPTSPTQSPPPGNRNGPTNPHQRSYSISSLPRPRSTTGSKIPLSPSRQSSHGLFSDSNGFGNIPPPQYKLSQSNLNSAHNNQNSHQSFTNSTNSRNSSPPLQQQSHSGFNNMNSSTSMMPPPGKALTATIRSRSQAANLNGSGRETLQERGGRALSSNPPAPGRSNSVSSASSRIGGTRPVSANPSSKGMKPKASLDSMRPITSYQGLARSTSAASKPPGGYFRPPSANDLRSEMEKTNVEQTRLTNSRPLVSKSVDDWDMDSALTSRFGLMESKIREIEDRTKGVDSENVVLREKYEAERTRVIELETARVQAETQLALTKMELEGTRQHLLTMTRELEAEREQRRLEVSDAQRRFRDEFDDLRRKHKDELDSLERRYKDEMASSTRTLRMELEDERSAKVREVQEVKTQAALEKQKLETKMDSKWMEIRNLKEELENASRDLERERILNGSLRDTLSEHSATSLSYESSQRALRARIEELELLNKDKIRTAEELQLQLQEAHEAGLATREKLRKEETLRRKLHNQVQELKGNIRVFCRVRPPLGDEATHAADIKFPDVETEGSKIEVVGPQEKSALGNVVTKTYPFGFDKVFGPSSQNSDVFEEISQLVQSALDGYNVCIFCYGQTGSGKTYTMSSPDGMIPMAVHQIYDTAQSLEEKGWKYSMEGSFVEVYNENINDLLGRPDDLDKKKHEIRHDPKEKQTTVTGLTTVVLDTPQRVETILKTAHSNRSVAATKANERSSRSHSVFMLKLIGHNSLTGERSEGTLNLVDLAGSERLSHSQASGDRLKETQSINKSLSCLGDVIGALGSGKEGAHIPYRNSKLTYLLQYSLGGNSKTLMFVMVSPLQAHLSESLTSLKFATKVSNTYIGTARKRVTA